MNLYRQIGSNELYVVEDKCNSGSYGQHVIIATPYKHNGKSFRLITGVELEARAFINDNFTEASLKNSILFCRTVIVEKNKINPKTKLLEFINGLTIKRNHEAYPGVLFYFKEKQDYFQYNLITERLSYNELVHEMLQETFPKQTYEEFEECILYAINKSFKLEVVKSIEGYIQISKRKDNELSHFK